MIITNVHIENNKNLNFGIISGSALSKIAKSEDSVLPYHKDEFFAILDDFLKNPNFSLDYDNDKDEFCLYSRIIAAPELKPKFYKRYFYNPILRLLVCVNELVKGVKNSVSYNTTPNGQAIFLDVDKYKNGITKK